MGLAGVVGSQLGQTLLSGGASLPVLLTGIGSAAVLVAIIQTPVVSHFFGCQPLGPFAWVGASGSSAFANYLSITVPKFFDRITDRFHQGVGEEPSTHPPEVEERATPEALEAVTPRNDES